ncbi:hypothetical protein [Candidatus Nitrosopumilus sediminis]|uniref:Uncharacterized protein n=1 Tax=Candidatus Nitrosopumilus sediminis TaxID=1229909 RepID=K0BHD3_9ARCH|nr:hypothetical protein [Candidatus Nitrosopumilus sediminis]AFS83701.1 hypothetical protein NSED_09555 [Candidatus Nitrosopumilus sediminis]
MKLCNICHKISATNEDHLDCIQRRNIELGDEDFKNRIPEKLNLSNTENLSLEVKAILEHLSKNKDSEE